MATDENGKKLCILNDLNGVSAGANLPMHGPATHRYVCLSEQEVFDYLGTAIQPELPAGLAAHPGEKSWQFIYTKASGDIFFDGCGFTYADRFDADGYPAANAKSLKILASKMGYRCGIYYCGEEPLVTNMHGTDVTFGKAKDQPVYTAEFKKDGVQYTVTGENLELIELYQAVRSLILS